MARKRKLLTPLPDFYYTFSITVSDTGSAPEIIATSGLVYSQVYTICANEARCSIQCCPFYWLFISTLGI
jgi:hypothetical protein